MTKNYDEKIVLSKIETTEGTAESPTGAADALLVYNFQENFLGGEEREKAYDQAYFGAKQTQLVRLTRGATFRVPLAGAGGAATVVPAWMKLNRPGGFNAGVAGASSVVQSPITASIPSATQWYSIGGEIAKVAGARCGMTIVFEDDEDPYIEYSYLGRPIVESGSLAVDASIAGVSVTTFKDAQPFNTENSTVSLDSYSPPVRRITLTSNAQLNLRSLVGPQDRVLYRNRSWGGEIVIEAPSLSAKDYYARVFSRAKMALAITHGLGTGNIVEVAAPQLQFGMPSRGDEDGALMLTLPFRLIPTTAGNDEIVITTK